MEFEPLSFNLRETLHAVALLPCLFSIVLLFVVSRTPASIVVPALFFLVLSASFFIGLAPVLYPGEEQLLTFLIWLESTQPAICFLLVVQLWRKQVPGPLYWLILALPVIGGTSLVYASLRLDAVCLLDQHCLEAYEFRTLYHLFASCLIFLLLIVHLSRLPITDATKSRYESHRYWLIMALVGSYLFLLIIDLAMLTGHVSLLRHETTHVIMRICFLYLVMTSLFRVFDHHCSTTSAGPKPVDPEVIDRIRHAMEEEKLYREMNFNREQCAERLNMPEHILSRAINQAFDKNFNEYINSYRIEEAKGRLKSEETSVTAIAFEVGFSSIASFNRVFKAMVGKSPTEYRSSGGAA